MKNYIVIMAFNPDRGDWQEETVAVGNTLIKASSPYNAERMAMKEFWDETFIGCVAREALDYEVKEYSKMPKEKYPFKWEAQII